MKKKLLFSVILSIFAILFFSQGVFAESLDEVELEKQRKAILEGNLEELLKIDMIGINAEDPGTGKDSKYPGTNIYVKPGDVIYSPKSFSTFFFGH